MEDQVVFFTGCGFVVLVLAISFVKAYQGSAHARYFLWSCCVLSILAVPLLPYAHAFDDRVTLLMMLAFSLYVLYGYARYGRAKMDVSHEETRLVLAESNRRIEEERREVARRLHDDVNPNLIILRTVLQSLQKSVSHDPAIAEKMQQVGTLFHQSYTELRDIVRMTRTELIDSIGFTGALEAMVADYDKVLDRMKITLQHNLPKRPDLPDSVAMGTYKIIREALMNAIKHSGADIVQIRVNYREATAKYTIAIEDNGIGLPSGPYGERPSGIGIIDMRERAILLGTNLKLQSSAMGTAARPGLKVSFCFSVPSS